KSHSLVASYDRNSETFYYHTNCEGNVISIQSDENS
ncbi:unnamed protein product, partial [marine sediment metagenome]